MLWVLCGMGAGAGVGRVQLMIHTHRTAARPASTYPAVAMPRASVSSEGVQAHMHASQPAQLLPHADLA